MSPPVHTMRSVADTHDVHSRVLVIEDWRRQSERRAENVDRAIEAIRTDIAAIKRTFSWVGGVMSAVAVLFSVVKLLIPFLERMIQ